MLENRLNLPVPEEVVEDAAAVGEGVPELLERLRPQVAGDLVGEERVLEVLAQVLAAAPALPVADDEGAGEF